MINLLKKSIFLVALMLVLSMGYAYAASVQLSHEDLNARVSPGETAVFSITIKNDRNTADEYSIGINVLDIYPFSTVIENAELSQRSVKLRPKESATVELKLKIFEDAVPNVNYKTYVIVKSLANPDIMNKEYLVASVLSPTNMIDISTNFPSQLIASNDQEFELTLKNKVNRFLKDVEISISSEFLQESFVTNLSYGTTLVKRIKYDLDPSTKSGIYTLSIKAFYNKNVRGSLLREFEIVKNPNVLEKNELESGFLVDVYTFKKENKGNVAMEESVFLPLGSIERYFTRANVKPTKKMDAGFEWAFTLSPGETYLITAKTDYRSIFYGSLIIILFAFGLWYHLHRTITIKKILYHVKDEKSGLSELKVLLKVKNRGSPLRHVRVVDIVPGLFKSTGEYGTLKPILVQPTYSGMRLVWELPAFDIGDERLISYKLASKTHMSITTILPPAAVIYKKLNKQITKTSNKVVYVPKGQK